MGYTCGGCNLRTLRVETKGGQQLCPRCAWEARVAPVEELAPGSPSASPAVSSTSGPESGRVTRSSTRAGAKAATSAASPTASSTSGPASGRVTRSSSRTSAGASTGALPAAGSSSEAYKQASSHALLHANERDRRNTLQHAETTAAKKDALLARRCCRCGSDCDPWHTYDKSLDQWVSTPVLNGSCADLRLATCASML